MRQAKRNPEGGQALAEYAIIVAAIAVGCLFPEPSAEFRWNERGS